MTAGPPELRRARRDRGRRPERDGSGARTRSSLPSALSSPLLRRLLIAAAFAVPFGWDLVEAIADLLALLAFAQAAGHPLNSYAWLVLGTAILVPPAAYVGALIVGWPRGPLRLAATLGVGLAATAAVSLTLEALLRA